MLGDQAPYAGVAPWFQGVIAGDIPPIGLGAEPKNIPEAAGQERQHEDRGHTDREGGNQPV